MKLSSVTRRVHVEVVLVGQVVVVVIVVVIIVIVVIDVIVIIVVVNGFLVDWRRVP